MPEKTTTYRRIDAITDRRCKDIRHKGQLIKVITLKRTTHNSTDTIKSNKWPPRWRCYRQLTTTSLMIKGQQVTNALRHKKQRTTAMIVKDSNCPPPSRPPFSHLCHERKVTFVFLVCYIQVKLVLQLVPNILQIASEDNKQNVCMHVPRLVSRYGLAVRRLAGKQKDLGSIRFGSHFSSLQKLWFMDTLLCLCPHK